MASTLFELLLPEAIILDHLARLTRLPSHCSHSFGLAVLWRAVNVVIGQ
jgi:hypothetical protein